MDPQERPTGSLPETGRVADTVRAGRPCPIEEAERVVGDRYRIEHLAGTGGMGRVFAARDTTLGRRVAIKLLGVREPSPASDGETPTASHERLVGEARAMARLDHAHLCRVIEVQLEGPAPYLVMDWADGIDLKRWFDGKGRRQRLTVFMKVVDAVAAMHAEGQIHGDLKPANVLVSRKNEPMIVDFGLACAEAEGARPGRRGGTPGYSAPEQFDETGIGPTADVFALGVIMFELLADRAPYPAGSSPAVLAQLMRHGDPPLPERYAPNTPADLQKICLSAMERDPEARYADAGALALDLRRYLRRETVSARPTVLARRFDEQVQRQIDAVREWRRLGLVTAAESERLLADLQDLQRADSPWLIDARRLRFSQVLLHVGGWVLVLGLVYGLARSWGDLPPAVGHAWAWATAIAVAAMGKWLHGRGQKRIGLGMLVTAQLAIPGALWLLLRETGTLGAGMGPSLEFASVILGQESPPAGLANRQILGVAVFGLALAGLMRGWVRSAAFSFFAVCFAVLAWVGVFLAVGRLDAGLPEAIAELGLGWLVPMACVAAALGGWLDAAEQRLRREFGAWRARRRDAMPVLTGAVTLLVVGLTSAALAAPLWYQLRSTAEGQPGRADNAFALGVNGVAMLGAMLLLGRRETPLRRRLASLLRWLVPSHIIGAVFVLEYEAWGGAWWPWLAAGPVLAGAFCLASVVRQWKPFLVSGLVALAVWYVRLFARIDELLEAAPVARLIATGAALVLGPLLMLAAWRGPILAGKLRLARWSRQTGTAQPKLRERSWRD